MRLHLGTQLPRLHRRNTENRDLPCLVVRLQLEPVGEQRAHHLAHRVLGVLGGIPVRARLNVEFVGRRPGRQLCEDRLRFVPRNFVRKEDVRNQREVAGDEMLSIRDVHVARTQREIGYWRLIRLVRFDRKHVERERLTTRAGLSSERSRTSAEDKRGKDDFVKHGTYVARLDAPGWKIVRICREITCPPDAVDFIRPGP